MEKLTAEQAIAKIRGIKSEFMGMEVPKYNLGIEVRAELQKMMESGEISPSEGYKALKIEFEKMGPGEKRAEIEQLSGEVNNAE